MPIIVVDIESEPIEVTPEEKRKLIEYVYEEETDTTYSFADARDDKYDNIVKYKGAISGSISGSAEIPPQQTTTGSRETGEGFTKPDAKEKDNEGPEGAPVDVENSGALTTEKKEEVKKTNPPSLGTTIKNYLEQGEEKLQDPTYWAYRSVDVPEGGRRLGKPENEKLKTIPAIEGYVKYYFDASWDKLTSGISINSVWDVMIAMNASSVGVFNPIVPYTAEENTEQHMMMLRSKDHVYNKGKDTAIGIYPGKFGVNPSWADEPWWCGIFTNFVTSKSGLTVSGDPTGVGFYDLDSVKSGLINRPNKLPNPNYLDKPSQIPKWFHNNSPTPEYWETYSDTGNCVVFVNGIHYSDNGGLTKWGTWLANHITGKLDWEMATISRGGAHIEVCAWASGNKVITLGGNTGTGTIDKNGNTMVVRETSFGGFGIGLPYVLVAKVKGTANRHGTKLSSPFKITETMQKYFDAVNNQTPNITGGLKKILSKITK